jgi:hypothetical protein
MGLFFNADKYITRVESPRVNRSLERKAQVLEYIEKYFDMYSHEYLEDVYRACRDYIEETMDDQDPDSKPVTSAEVQAATTIARGLKDFVANGKLENLQYMRVLAAKEAFKLYCAMISKALEMEILDKKQAKRRITKFYRECGLD